MFPYYIMTGGSNTMWTELIHNGPLFPPPYTPHNIMIRINNTNIKLTNKAEEYITMYCRYLDTPYVLNSRFNKNFLYDWKKELPDVKINNMSEVDMTNIKIYLQKLKEEKNNMTKEMREMKKKEEEEFVLPYKYCYIDGSKMKVGNYRIEPPGIFLGRGDHPKLGRIKKRINPDDVIINIGKDVTIPKPNVSGKWKEIIHNRNVVWLATWVDNISGKNKYVFTSMESIFKSKSDMDKFDLAKKLKKKIKHIRTYYYNDMKSDDKIKKQLATALYLIDNLALRVGGKKDTKEKADTVGVTSLRNEHIILYDDNIIKLDFLGKDSVRYCKKVKVDPIVYNNIKEFTDSNRKDLLFNKINSTTLNQYLDNMMHNLTAKVWRTYNASILFQKELDKVDPKKMEKLPETERINYLISIFNQANTMVAILCNHQKNVSSNLTNMVDKIDTMIKKLKERKKKTNNKEKLSKINAQLIILKMKKETKIKMKNVSLGTSKNNYIDPRIIFAFIKKYNIPEDKLFNTALLTRFEWARNISQDYKF